MVSSAWNGLLVSLLLDRGAEGSCLPERFGTALLGLRVIFPFVFVFFCNSHLSPTRRVPFLSSERKLTCLTGVSAVGELRSPGDICQGSCLVTARDKMGISQPGCCGHLEPSCSLLGGRWRGCPVHSRVFSSSRGQ